MTSIREMFNKNRAYTGPLKLVAGENCDAWAFVGSRVINPKGHRLGTDHDILVLASGDKFDELVGFIMNDLDNVEMSGSGDSGGLDGFESMKVEDDQGRIYNYLVYKDRGNFEVFIKLTEAIINLGITDKLVYGPLFAAVIDLKNFGDYCLPVNPAKSAIPGAPF